MIEDYHKQLHPLRGCWKPLMRIHGTGALPAHGEGALACMRRLPGGLHCDLARAGTPRHAEGNMDNQSVREGQLHSCWSPCISCTPACSMPVSDPSNLTGSHLPA